MSFAEKWKSRKNTYGNKDNKDKRGETDPKQEAFVPSVPFAEESESVKISKWGDHADLIRWFLSVKSSLPTKPFCLWKGEHGSVHWMTPAASYEVLTREIMKGPDGEHGEEVKSILEQLHAKFEEGASRC